MKSCSNRNIWIGALIGMTVATQAATTIVDFELDGIPSQRKARAADVGEVGVGSGDRWSFSDSTALIDAGTLEDGTARRSLRVYGGMNTSWNPSADYKPHFRIDREKKVLQLQINAIVEGKQTNNKIEGIFVWNKADFFGGFDTKLVGFDASSSMSISFPYACGWGRFVVNDGGTYYVSQSIYQGSASHTLSDPESVCWAPISTDGNYWTGEFLSHRFKDIQGVGFYVNMTQNGGNQLNFLMTDFQVSAVEHELPATLGLIFASAGRY